MSAHSIEVDDEESPMLEAIKTAIDSITPVIGDMDRKLSDLTESIRVLSERMSAMAASGAAVTGGSPAAVPGPFRPARRVVSSAVTSPANYEISTRPYKSSPLTTNKFAPNSSGIFHPLFQIAKLESEYPGSQAAVVEIMVRCMYGFENGVAPLDYAELRKNSMTAAAAMFAESQRPSFADFIAQLVRLPGNLSDEANREKVADTQRKLNKIFGGNNSAPASFARDHLASLYQKTTVTTPQIYRAAQQRASTKENLGQTYLGIVWWMLLPEATKAKVAFTPPANVHAPIPRILFETDAASASASASTPAPTGNAI